MCPSLARSCVPRLLRLPRRRLCSASSSSAGEASTSSTSATPIAETTRERIISLGERYIELLTDYPLATNAATTGMLCSVGDVLAQLLEYKLDIMSPDKTAFNWQRTLRMGLWGTVICGPVLSVWYRGLHAAADALRISYAPIVSGRMAWLLERAPSQAASWLANLHQPKVLPAAPTPVQLLLGKVAFDTMIFQAPFLNLYFAVMGALEGLSFSQIVEKTRASFHRAWFLSFMVWTPVQLLNLHFVPLPLQASVVATVMMGWCARALQHYCTLPASPRPLLGPLSAPLGPWLDETRSWTKHTR